ncbi:MAG: DUF58 domain-containing protein [Gammaproteobacteria bacterium]
MNPTRRLMLTVMAVFLFGFVTLWFQETLGIWTACSAFVLLIFCFDAMAALLQSRVIKAERTTSDTLSLGAWHDVSIDLTNSGRNHERIDVIDHHPSSYKSDARLTELRLEPEVTKSLRYRVQPTERGQHEFDLVQVRRYSPWGFWTIRHNLGEAQTTRVFPNFTAISKYALRGADSLQAMAASHVRQRRGEGLDFHQLREYRVGDTFRQIDWKASTRSHKLISKEFQEERDQQVIFLLDSGRRMLARDGDLSHFDHVLNTVMLLGYIALRQGDAVGYMTCEPDPRWLPATKGRSTINTLSRQLFDMQPRPEATDYWQAATELAKRQRRRALVILVTNVRDEDSQDLHKAIGLLRQKHLLVVASLTENAIADRLEAPVTTFDDALHFAATHDYVARRRSAQTTVSRRGVYMHDTDCDSLPGVLTDQYMAIKRAGIL